MSQDVQVRFMVYPGPSPLAPFPAVLAEFQPPAGEPLAGQALRPLLEGLLPRELSDLAEVPDEPFTLASLGAYLALGACDRHGPWGFRSRVMEAQGQPSRIFLEQVVPTASLEALKVGLELAHLVFQHGYGNAVDPRPCQKRVRGLLIQWDVLHSDPYTLGQMRIAHRRGIPVYDVASAPRFRVFGQGAASRLTECTADDRDGYSGCHLAGDKALTNELVRRLGLPGVEHRIVQTEQEALAAAQHFGFPLVVKPQGGDMGKGVTAGIVSETELVQAFHHCKGSHPSPVLVERFVEGDVHRMVALEGRFAWAIRLRSARVTGDGTRTVAELLAAENARRATVTTKPTPRQLQPDAPMVVQLQRQGLSLDARPEAGRVVLLRTTSNVVTGGTAEIVTEAVHPDNRGLVETLGRAFRLATTGIDFITPDISRSWREGGCALLEVNPTPGIGSDPNLEALMDSRFPGGSDGRIPTVLLLGAPPEAAGTIHEALSKRGLRTGLVTPEATRLGQEVRFPEGGPLPARVRGLLLDPGCEALVVGQEPLEAESQGLPLDRFDVVLLGEVEAAQAPLHAMAHAGARSVLPWTGPETVARVLEALPLQP